MATNKDAKNGNATSQNLSPTIAVNKLDESHSARNEDYSDESERQL